ncbi:ATP-binding protein [Streptomyces xiamenensis]
MLERGFVLAVGRYPCVAASVRRARRIAVEAYAPYPGVDRFAVELLISELATNAVLHATGDSFDVLCHSPLGGSVQVEVHDRCRAVPVRRQPAVQDESGRGLELLDTLASHWRTERTANGKSLIFTLQEGSCSNR